MAESAIVRSLKVVLIAASLWYLGAYLVVACLRLRYPFDLEWMEGGSVDHVARVLRFQSLYIAPQIAFIPFEYPPLYYYVSALVAKIVGLGYLPLRLVSFASSLLCFACIYTLVKVETRSPFNGVLAAGLFAAAFRISGAWFDLARVDSLFLALFLAAIVIIRCRESSRWYLLAGVVLALSFLTKQTALAMAGPVVVYALYSDFRRGLWLAGGLAVIVGVSSAVLHAATGGWYTFYVFEFPFKHAWAPPVSVTFWTEDMFARLPIAFTVTFVLVVWRLRRSSLFWPLVFAGMIGGAYRSRLQTGGYDNVLMPAYACAAILFSVGVCTLAEAVRRSDITHKRLTEPAIYGGCLVQMALLAYNPGAQIPRAADRAAGEHLLQVLADIPGDVLLPSHGYLPSVAGKPPHAHMMSVFDVLKIREPESDSLAAQYRTAIRQSAFGAIILDENVDYFFLKEIQESYLLQSRVFADPGVFLPVTGGVVTRPEFLYVPKARVARSATP